MKEPPCENQLLHEEACRTTLISRITLSSMSLKFRKEGSLNSYSEVIDYLLEANGTDDVVSQMIARILRFTQP